MRTITLVGVSIMLAACSAEQAADDESAAAKGEMDHSSHDMAAMDHSEHKMGPPTEEAMKVKKAATALLVERFGVDECSSADLIGSLRRTNPEEGETLMRAYTAPIDCAEKTLAQIKSLGFTQGEPGNWTGKDTEGADELVIIKMTDGEERGTLEWQSVQK